MTENDHPISPCVCIGCGETIGSENVAVEGLDICRQCLTPRNVPLRLIPFELYPPLFWTATMGALLLGSIIVGGLVGYPIDAGFRYLGFNTGGLGSAIGACSGVILFGYHLRKVTAWLQQRWKRMKMRRFGLAHLPRERFTLVTVLYGPFEWNEEAFFKFFPSAKIVRLLAETEDKLVFLGRDAEIRVIQLSEICGNDYPGGGGYRWLALGFHDESCIYIHVMEGGENALGRCAATVGLGRRVYDKVHPS